MKITFYKSNNKDNHSFVVLHDGSQHIPRGKTNDEKKNGLKKNIDQTSSGKTALRIFKNKIFYELNKIIDDKIDTDKDLLAFAEIDDFHDLYHNENKIFFYTQAENLIKRY
ncbi:MAG: hypothetical protein GY710_07205 [Desulfobacteraceae bacterium]|nr:hypothetical protein [Desulfobacteraceae bacterium]